MRTTDGKVPAYNVQTAVDAEHVLIVTHQVSTAGNDSSRLQPVAEAVRVALGNETEAINIVADTGYSNGEQAGLCEASGLIPHIPAKRSINSHGDGTLLDRTVFRYQPETDTFLCPASQLLQRKQLARKDRAVVYQGQPAVCGACALKPTCTLTSRRFVTRHLDEEVLNRMHLRATPQVMRLRRAAMPKGLFLPSEFVPTEWSSAADRADFGNVLLHVLDADCPRQLFTKKFYTRLSMTFGNIAHYNLEGFYDTWFTRDRHRLAFVQKILRWPCHGDPKFTFSDVERVIQRVVRERSYLARFGLRAAEALRVAEMTELERLEVKYRRCPAEESNWSAGRTRIRQRRGVLFTRDNSENDHFELSQALLIYTSQRQSFVTRHEVTLVKDGPPSLGPAQPLTLSFVESLVRSLSGASTAEVLPDHVLAKGDRMIAWWTPVCRRQMFYENSEEKAAHLNGRTSHSLLSSGGWRTAT